MPESDDRNTVQLLMGKVESIQRRADELAKLNRQGKILSFIVVIAIALAAFFSLFRTYTTIRSFPQRLYAYHMSQEALKLQPVLEDHLAQLAKNVRPSYEEAFKKEFVDKMPEISEKASAQASLFLQNIGDRLEARLDKAVQKIVDDHAKALAKDHPELKDDAVKKKVMQQAQEIYYSAAQSVAKEIFAQQTKAIADLAATLETFETPNQFKTMNDEKLIQHTLDTLTQLLARRLSFVEIDEQIQAPAKAEAKTEAR